MPSCGCFFCEKFPTRRTFSDGLKFREHLTPQPLPRRHWTEIMTEYAYVVQNTISNTRTITAASSAHLSSYRLQFGRSAVPVPCIAVTST